MNIAQCNYNTVSERDMDMLFLQLFSSDLGIVNLFLEKAGIPDTEASVVDITLSKADPQLGESDITVILEAGKKRIALLIEDKIDAVAMPDQPERYIKRGNKAVKNGEYDEFISFLICPKKYYDNNETAKRYPHVITYETVRGYLKTVDTPLYHAYCQQIEQALDKARKPAEVILNEKANAFFRKYKEYQKTHFPGLDLRTKEEANGYWANYSSAIENTYIDHKIREGRVDLTFNKAAGKIDVLHYVAEWLRSHSLNSVQAKVISKSGSLQIAVPKLDMEKPFEKTDGEELLMCFKAIEELSRFASVVAMTSGLGER